MGWISARLSADVLIFGAEDFPADESWAILEGGSALETCENAKKKSCFADARSAKPLNYDEGAVRGGGLEGKGGFCCM
tara:strand:- start:390 stop:623 length:234 start_codon:yes stop_codon:yes gene_type:complete